MAILSNVEIKANVDKKCLIIDGDLTHIGPACYELSMGTIYYDLTEGDKRLDASEFGSVLIKPGHRVVLLTKEEVVIPNDLLARITSKGSLFSVGLTPVSTYADPGFSGNLGIVTQNMSHKYILLPIGEPIAKIDFSFLVNPSTNPYRGQHGFKTSIWPIKYHLQKEYSEIKHDKRVGTEEEEAFGILPYATSSAIRQVLVRQRKIGISLIIMIFINIAAFAAMSSKMIDPIIAIATNLISSAVVGLFTWFSAPMPRGR